MNCYPQAWTFKSGHTCVHRLNTLMHLIHICKVLHMLSSLKLIILHHGKIFSQWSRNLHLSVCSHVLEICTFPSCISKNSFCLFNLHLYPHTSIMHFFREKQNKHCAQPLFHPLTICFIYSEMLWPFILEIIQPFIVRLVKIVLFTSFYTLITYIVWVSVFVCIYRLIILYKKDK